MQAIRAAHYTFKHFMITDLQVEAAILEALSEATTPLSAREITAAINRKNPSIDEWMVRESIWDLTAAYRTEITREWKVELSAHEKLCVLQSI
jgi:repressor of nif and glnA expression